MEILGAQGNLRWYFTLSRYLAYLFTLKICYWYLMPSRYAVICFSFLQLWSP